MSVCLKLTFQLDRRQSIGGVLRNKIKISSVLLAVQRSGEACLQGLDCVVAAATEFASGIESC